MRRYTIYRRRPSGTYTRLQDTYSQWRAESPEQALRLCIDHWRSSREWRSIDPTAGFLVGWLEGHEERFQAFTVRIPEPSDYIIEATA